MNTKHYSQRLISITKEIEKAKETKIKSETQLENYKRELAEIEKQFKELGVKPEDADKKIEELNNQVAENLSKIEAILDGEEVDDLGI